MKVLENILKILTRILNIPLAVLNFVFNHIVVFVWMIVSLLEFFVVMPVYYIITGKWYYDARFNHPYRYWFPIAHNIENIINALPSIMIDENLIDFSKHYSKEEQTEDNK